MMLRPPIASSTSRMDRESSSATAMAVRALGYVAALQPDVGETTGQLAASIPGEVPTSDLKPTKDGFIFVDPTKFAADVAADLHPAQAKYMANSQMPVAAAAFEAPVT